MERKRINQEAGFTLIEIAIVVVIIGLLMGGVLKGQEMIRNARVHNLANQSNGINAAMLGFQDRYRSLPGDYLKAYDNIPNMVPSGSTAASTDYNGDGNGRVGGDPASTNTTETGSRKKEIALFWRQLAKSGFIGGDYDGSTTSLVAESAWTCPSTTCPSTAYNGALMFAYGDEYYDVDDKNASVSTTAGAKTKYDSRVHELTIGGNVPVEVIAEADAKVDDGNPGGGIFRVADLYSTATTTTGTGTSASTSYACVAKSGTTTTAKVDRWDITGQYTNCGGVFMM